MAGVDDPDLESPAQSHDELVPARLWQVSADLVEMDGWRDSGGQRGSRTLLTR